MLRILQQFTLTMLFAVFASQASAMFIQADWFDPTQPGVGTNRYAYSSNDPINRMDPGGNDSVWSNGDGTWSSSDGSTYDPDDPSNNSYDIGSDQYGYTVAPGYSPPELPGVNDINVTNSGRATVVTVTDRGVTASGLAMNPGHAGIVKDQLERQVQSQQPEAAVAGVVFDVATTAIGVGSTPAAASTVLFGRSAPRVFWSGQTAGVSVMDNAAAYAAQNGMKTLEMTPAGKALTTATSILGFDRTRSLWSAASAGFARSARSTSVAIQGTTVRPNSIWHTIERPILQQRGIGYSVQTVR